MMGIKERTFQPLPEIVSLGELVPKDNFDPSTHSGEYGQEEKGPGPL